MGLYFYGDPLSGFTYDEDDDFLERIRAKLGIVSQPLPEPERLQKKQRCFRLADHSRLKLITADDVVWAIKQPPQTNVVQLMPLPKRKQRVRLQEAEVVGFPSDQLTHQRRVSKALAAVSRRSGLGRRLRPDED